MVDEVIVLSDDDDEDDDVDVNVDLSNGRRAPSSTHQTATPKPSEQGENTAFCFHYSHANGTIVCH